jgi:RHS repeat-associated protein
MQCVGITRDKRTIRDLINNSGAIIDHVDYSAFGTVLDESSPSNGDRMMGFAGMERDTVTGLNLAVNRVQNPGTGRWTSQDPMGFVARDADLYRYVGNGPTNFTDKSGLLSDEQIDLINAFSEARSNGASNDEIIATIIMEALYLTNGNNTEAFGLIYGIRNENKGAFDNDLWASADHFFNAWNAQDWYRNHLGNHFFSRWLGGLNGDLANQGYVVCKIAGIPTGQDNPNVPPTDPTIQQWKWGNLGAWASTWYPTNMRPGSPEWRSFIAWMESTY